MISPLTPSDDWPVIFSYTRKQAIEDGVLVDLTEWAQEEGFTIPLACTAAVWNQCITPPKGIDPSHGQSERGRAHDLMFLLYLAIRQQLQVQGGGDRVLFDVQFLDAHGKRQAVELKCICGPGDPPDYPSVLTVMFPYED